MPNGNCVATAAAAAGIGTAMFDCPNGRKRWVRWLGSLTSITRACSGNTPFPQQNIISISQCSFTFQSLDGKFTTPNCILSLLNIVSS
jgi:hypothetical protein